MTKERYSEIEEILLDIDFELWDKNNVLEPSSFTLGYLCGKDISVQEASIFCIAMLMDKNSKIDKKLTEKYGE